MDRYQKRILKLREHVLSQQYKDKKENLIQDINGAHELAIKEDMFISLESMKVDELKNLAKGKDVEGYSKMKKDELVAALVGK